MPIYGTDVEIAIVQQNSWNTVADIANSGTSIPVISETFNAQQPLMASESLRGRIDRGESYAGAKEVTGDIECEAEPASLGYLIGATLEHISAVTSDSLRTHTFKPYSSPFGTGQETPKVPITFMRKSSVVTRNYFNLNATGLELSCAAGEFLKIKVPFIGGRNDNGTTGMTASYGTNAPFTFDQCSFSIDGAGVGYVKSFSLTVDDAIEAQHVVDNGGDQWPDRIVRSGFRSGTINMTMSFDTSSEYIAYRGDNASASAVAPLAQQVVATFTQGIEAQSGYPHSLKIDMPSVKWESLDNPVEGVGEIEISMTGRVKYNSGSGTMLDITLVDTIATY